MPEIFHTRDCIVYYKDDAYTVTVDTPMVQGGWPGGQGAEWVGSVDDEFLVTYSRGRFGGFLVWGSDEEGDDHTAMTRNQPHYRFATMLSGAALIATSSYERYTWASRQVGPLVPLTYGVNDKLYLSLRGLWTNEDELTVSGDPDAPAPLAGIAAQVPKELNNWFVGIQTVM
jgi:hypothetical protein